MTAALRRALEAARALKPEERHQLRARLADAEDAPKTASEAVFAEQLALRGVLVRVARSAEKKKADDFEPPTLSGDTSASDTLLAQRR